MRTKHIIPLACKHFTVTSIVRISKQDCDTASFMFGDIDGDTNAMAVCDKSDSENRYAITIDRIVDGHDKEVPMSEFDVINDLRFLFCDRPGKKTLEECVCTLISKLQYSHFENEVVTVTYTNNCRVARVYLDAENNIIKKEGF